jgi:O-antigen/teichoic acid export membrane protein
MSESGGGKLKGMFRDTIFVVLGTYSSYFLSLIISIVLARKLSNHNYGVYSVMLGGYMQGAMALSLGISPIIQRYLPEFLGKKNRRGALSLQMIGGLGHLLGGSIMVFLAWAFRDVLSSWLNVSEWNGLLPYFALFTILKFEATVFDEMLTAHRSQAFRNAATVGFQALKLTLFIVWLPSEGDIPLVGTLDKLFTFLVISNGVYLLAYLGRMIGLSKNIEGGGDEALPVKRMARYGLLQYATSLTLIALYTDIDTWIISHYQQASVAGTYRIATQIVTALIALVPMHLLLKVIVPVYVKEYTEKQDKGQLAQVFRFYNKVVTVFLFPLLVGALILAEPLIVHIYDPKWIDAVSPFRIYFAAMVATHFLNTMSFLPLILEKPEITLWSRLFLVYNIVMDFILIPLDGPFGGANGAAIATGSALIFGYVLSFAMLRKHIRVRIPWRANFRTIFFGGLMGLALWPLAGWISGIPSLLLVILAGILIYSALAWRFHTFDEAEADRLNTALGRRVFR